MLIRLMRVNTVARDYLVFLREELVHQCLSVDVVDGVHSKYESNMNQVLIIDLYVKLRALFETYVESTV